MDKCNKSKSHNSMTVSQSTCYLTPILQRLPAEEVMEN